MESVIWRSSAIFARAFRSITMRSTFIVGFPGETEEHVAYLERWIERAQLDRVGFFEYSAEEGTPAATLGDRVECARAAPAFDSPARSATHCVAATRAQRAAARRCACSPKSFLIKSEHGSGARKVKRLVSMAAFISQETLRLASSLT